MQLRNHPITSFRGFALWPPTWIDYRGTNEATRRGEVGVLRLVSNSPNNVGQISLTIEHEGAVYAGTLGFEYEFLGEYMTNFFKDCRGMTIALIGSVEIPLTFDTVKKPKLTGARLPEHSSELIIFPSQYRRTITPAPN